MKTLTLNLTDDQYAQLMANLNAIRLENAQEDGQGYDADGNEVEIALPPLTDEETVQLILTSVEIDQERGYDHGR